MENTFCFPMFYKNKHMISLRDIFSCVKDNNLDWVLFQFSGVGIAPGQISMPEFEQIIEKLPMGYHMQWDEMLAFTRNIEQTWDCLIVSNKPGTTIYRQNIEKDELDIFDYVIQAEDSTRWIIRSNQNNIIDFYRQRFLDK